MASIDKKTKYKNKSLKLWAPLIKTQITKKRVNLTVSHTKSEAMILAVMNAILAIS